MWWDNTTLLYIALPTHRVFADSGSDGSPAPADVNACTWHETYSPAENPKTICDLSKSVSLHNVTVVLHLYCKWDKWTFKQRGLTLEEVSSVIRLCTNKIRLCLTDCSRMQFHHHILRDEKFHWNLSFTILLMANSLNLNSAYYNIFRNLSIIAYLYN